MPWLDKGNSDIFQGVAPKNNAIQIAMIINNSCMMYMYWRINEENS